MDLGDLHPRKLMIGALVAATIVGVRVYQRASLRSEARATVASSCARVEVAGLKEACQATLGRELDDCFDAAETGGLFAKEGLAFDGRAMTACIGHKAFQKFLHETGTPTELVALAEKLSSERKWTEASEVARAALERSSDAPVRGPARFVLAEAAFAAEGFDAAVPPLKALLGSRDAHHLSRERLVKAFKLATRLTVRTKDREWHASLGEAVRTELADDPAARDDLLLGLEGAAHRAGWKTGH